MHTPTLLALGALSATASAATCVSASTTTTTTTTSSLPLTDYTAAPAPVSGISYDIDASFKATYAFNSTMVGYALFPRRRPTLRRTLTRAKTLSITSSSNATDYASFKCQFACNGNAGCSSFFGRYVDVGTNMESFECLTFTTM